MTEPAPGRLGFPLHALLATIPMGAFACAAAFDAASHLASEPFSYPRGSFFLIAIGVAGGVVAGISPVRTLLRLPRGSAAFRAGCWHVGLTDAAILLAVLSAALRDRDGYAVATRPMPLTLLLVATALVFVGGAAGARLTYRYRVGVEAAPGSTGESVS